MPLCSTCGIDFDRLDNTKCGLCELRCPGLSIPELRAINNKPQYMACGNASDLFENAVCNNCIKHYRNRDKIPAFIVRDAKLSTLLFSDLSGGSSGLQNAGSTIGFSQETSDILTSAQVYQKRASNTRLTQRPGTARGAEGGINLPVFKNLGKAAAFREEKKAKREETKLIGKGIRIAAMLWKMLSAKNNKLVEITPLRVVQIFSPQAITKSAFDDLLTSIKLEFEKIFPQAQTLNWGNTTVYAHENKAHCSVLQFDHNNNVQALLQAFIDRKLGTARNLEQRELEIRFVFLDKRVFQLEESDYDYEDSPASARTSQVKRKRTQLDSSRSMPPPQMRASSRATQPILRSVFRMPMVASHSMPPPQMHASSRAASGSQPILRSAFRMPTVASKWTRNPKMVKCSFIRTSATYKFDGLTVEFETKSANIEEIEIAADFDEGSEGRVGHGWSKIGIYARFSGLEYVVTQTSDVKSEESHVLEVLKAEYALLCLAHSFKTEFDRNVNENKVGAVPKFYFNYEGSIFGTLIPTSSGGRHLPHLNFIATRLLPCGKADPPVTKYTGNGNLGKPEDDLTKAVHAFVHFSLVTSQGCLLFCDLQGTLDLNGVPCLIDPQGHTTKVQCDVLNVYWNSGGRAVEDFLKEHLTECKGKNWVCDRLGVLNATILNDADTEDNGLTSGRRRGVSKKPTLSLMLD